MVGFLAGGFFTWGVDKVLPHLHMGFPNNEVEGIKTGWQRSVLLVMAITPHNIPEGLAVGVAFGAISANMTSATLAGAMIYVVVEELIPESQLNKNTDAATIGAMLGFAVMMPLDVALG